MVKKDRIRIIGDSLWHGETGTVVQPPDASGLVTVRLDCGGPPHQIPADDLEIMEEM